VQKDYFGTNGPQLTSQGYEIVPIPKGSKGCFEDNWTTRDFSKANGEYKGYGAGIKTRNNPAVDIDTTDKAMSGVMSSYVRDRLGDSPERVGLAPKTALIYRTDEPFTKVKSKVYEDAGGNTHAVEILGDGQQVVAHHVHPDTKQPYTWSADLPDRSDLPTITLDDANAIVKHFEDMVELTTDWEEKERGRKGKKARQEDNPFSGLPTANILSQEQVSEYVYSLDPDMSRDRWLEVLMGIKDTGQPWAEELARDWSAEGEKYIEKKFDKAWESITPGDGIGIGTVIKMATDLSDEDIKQVNRKTIHPQWPTGTVTSRPRLYGDHILKGYLTMLNGPGGVSKSVFTIAMALGVAIGRDLLNIAGGHSLKPRRVLMLNNEDGTNEIRLRLDAAIMAYNLTPAEIALAKKNLLPQSGYIQRIKLASLDKDNKVLPKRTVRDIIKFCTDNNVEVVFMDPLVSLHDNNENDNTNMDAVVAILRRIAGTAGVGIYFAHHSRKGATAGTVDENARGASALVNAVRASYGLSGMTEEEAQKFQLSSADERSRLVRLDSGKRNYAPRAIDAEWFRLESVELWVTCWETGRDVVESVGVPMPVVLDARVDGDELEGLVCGMVNDGRLVGQFWIGGDYLVPLRELLDAGSTSTMRRKLKDVPKGRENALEVFVGNDVYIMFSEKEEGPGGKVLFSLSKLS